MPLWPGKLREVGVLLLAGGAEDLTYDEQVKLVNVAAGFVGEGLERGGGRGRVCRREREGGLRY